MDSQLQDRSHLILFYRNVILKGLILFLIINFLFSLINPLPFLAQITAYNNIFPGRKRLPYGDTPEKDYNLSLFSMEAMFNSHEISAGNKKSTDYRVVLIGDSATWGYLLNPENTLSEQINKLEYQTRDNLKIKTYNLGYPVMSVTKDLLILSYAIHYKPDLIIWLITLESLPLNKQLFPPLLQYNSELVIDLIKNYNLNLQSEKKILKDKTFLDRSLIGQRRNIADIIRLQFYGFMWASTGIDHFIPSSYIQKQKDLSLDLSYYDFTPPRLNSIDLSLDVLKAGKVMAGTIPIMFINEPIYISQGENSDIRYNFYYPRWVYDDYRSIFMNTCQEEGWICLDLWNAINSDEFTNTAIHISPNGTKQLAKIVTDAILDLEKRDQ